MKHKPDEKQITWGITAFITAAAAILLYFVIKELPAVSGFGSKLIDIIEPFIFGLVFAYLLCPLYNLVTRKLVIFLGRRIAEDEGTDAYIRKRKKQRSAAKIISTIISVGVFIAVIAAIIWMIIPGLIDSLASVAKMMPEGVKGLKAFVNENSEKFPFIKAAVGTSLDNIGGSVTDVIQKQIVPRYSLIVGSFSAGISGVMTFLKNFFIGIIICIYFLNSKEIFAAQCKKFLIVLFKPKKAKTVLEGAEYTNETFANFISGTLFDAFVVGAICFIFMTLFGWHYSLLISCIVGVTNIIPFFGPFLGAIPSALLLLIVDSKECFLFVIFIIILQQVEGNIIAPKILGDSTGLSSFWVLFAILVGGGIFGFIGMVIGIPVFAVIFFYFSKGINSRLEAKGYSADLNVYKVDVYSEEEDRRLKEKKKRRKKQS